MTLYVPKQQYPVRLYGHQLGHASFTQVTDGFAWGLGHHGLLGGFVPIDFRDEEEVYPGSDCPISINTGRPTQVLLAHQHGQHKEKWLMLAPNSDRIPHMMTQWMPKMLTALLAPSSWAKGVLQNIFPGMPVHVVQHGVHGDYKPNVYARGLALLDYEKGRFRVLHMTSTNAQRKGTRELLDAWGRFTAKAAPDATLTLVVRYEDAPEISQWVADRKLQGVEVVSCDGMPRELVVQLFGEHHVVCQPSRAEGFGLIPLEARCAGVPVVATASTGHEDHMLDGPGCVIVETGDDTEIDDMPGASAPELSPDAVLEGLEKAHADYEVLQDALMMPGGAADLSARWTWAKRTGEAVRDLVEEVKA